MKKLISATPILKLIMLLIIMVAATGTYAAPLTNSDSTLTAELRHQLNANTTTAALCYPASVKRFYNHTNFQPAWIKPQNGEGQTWQAILLLDCVLQYGLSHNDYHPKELSDNNLYNILDAPGKLSISAQARFDIILTDAMITVINNLHYGKLNPEFSAIRIDTEIEGGFRAEASLLSALQLTKGHEFLAAIENVQPKSKEYHELQYHMKVMTGLRTGDCYDIPESDIRKMAINLERLRWANMDDSSFIQINIPSYSLQFFKGDSVYQFSVAVGKASSPTPTFNSKISYFTTAPDVRMLQSVFINEILPDMINDSNYLRNNHIAIYNKKNQFVVVNKNNLAQIAKHPNSYYARHASGCSLAQGNLVFHFANPFELDLHDMPAQGFFNQQDRAISSGCIWVDNAEKLAGLLLKNDGKEKDLGTLHEAVTNYKRETFMLNKQIPIKVTYLTCTVKEGALIFFKDIYNLDNSLEMALYNVNQNLVMR
jgi:murein L,D-transpeptidase YcbB/YkuD